MYIRSAVVCVNKQRIGADLLTNSDLRVNMCALQCVALVLCLLRFGSVIIINDHEGAQLPDAKCN